VTPPCDASPVTRQATTLFEFLEGTGARVAAYDVGRRIGGLARADFIAFEQAREPYPMPMQRQSRFALIQQDTREDPGDLVIWFLRLSLDEQGLLIPAERDYLLDRLFESAQANRRGHDPQDFLRDNPQAFTPREDRMALFHARVGADLGRPPSRFYAHALDYFRGAAGWDQWEFVGYQGIADVACRHTADPLDTALEQLPAPPLIALGHCLESQRIADPLLTAVLERLTRTLREAPNEIGVLAGLIRALASRGHERSVREVLRTVLATPTGRNVEILVAISGRAWEALADRDLLDRYLFALARNDHGRSAFVHGIGDLLSVPAIAPTVRRALRADDQDAEVRAAFDAMTPGDDGTAG
jgi:hypothetical protein